MDETVGVSGGDGVEGDAMEWEEKRAAREDGV